MKQFVFECMPMSCIDEDTGEVCSEKGLPLIPWDDPYPFYKGTMIESPAEHDDVIPTSTTNDNQRTGKKHCGLRVMTCQLDETDVNLCSMCMCRNFTEQL